MMIRPDAEDLIHETLADARYAGEVEQDFTEILKTMQKPPRLTAGDKVALLKELDCDRSFVKRPDFLIARGRNGPFREHISYRSSSPLVDLAHDLGAAYPPYARQAGVVAVKVVYCPAQRR